MTRQIDISTEHNQYHAITFIGRADVFIGAGTANDPKIGTVSKQDRAVPSRNAIKWGTVTEWAATDKYGGHVGYFKTRRDAIQAVVDDHELLLAADRRNLAATVTLTDDREYEQRFGGSCREVLVFAGRRFSVGYIADGDEARQVFQGPMVPGPWGWANPCPIVISAHRDPNPRPEIAIAEGDYVIAGGVRYVVRDARKTDRLANSHWVALDVAEERQ